MPSRYVHDFDAPPPAAGDLPRLLGGKGANLVVMATDLGLPVPPGFTITTEACVAFLRGGWPERLNQELRAHMERLEARLGRRFGDPIDPLLVSVRSGAPVSMPGMMDTILNLGLTDRTAAGLAEVTGDPAFAADCLRRFRDGYRTVTGAESVPGDPWVQLRAAIDAVFRSWNSDRARAYREREGIAEELGTAVTVQAMVFGNRGADSGTGVVFTRNPSTGEPGLYGDVLFGAQGEDVVAGTHRARPLAELDERLPAAAAELRTHATRLERHYADLCDIEFTIEQGRLWLLQVRIGKRSPRAALRMATDMAEDPTFPLSREEAVRRVVPFMADPPRIFFAEGTTPPPIATGLPASPGVVTGGIVTTPDAAEAAAADGRSVILVRSETSPEDVRGMAVAAGVLTARGGLASHAAVVARGWGIPAVVGAEAVRPGEGSVDIGDRKLVVGEEITIDGGLGRVYLGALAGRWEVAPEAAALAGWAAELGIKLGKTEDDRHAVATERPKATRSLDAPDADELLRALLIRGASAPAQLVEALGAPPDAAVEGLVDRLRKNGMVQTADEAVRLSSEGKLRALALFAEDRMAIGGEVAAASLESFHAFDGRMKQIVTAWQIRDVDGEQLLNDHGDAAYDTGVLRDLAALDEEMSTWLTPLSAALRRFAVYRSRLGRAVELAEGGDQRFVASPRVDSYHTVWFELHEDLIRLCGRSRSEEAAAGRA